MVVGAAYNTELVQEEELPKDFYYLAEISCTRKVWVKKAGNQPKLETEGCTVGELLKAKHLLNWQTHKISEGEKGPLVAAFERIRVYLSPERTAQSERWLLLRNDANRGKGFSVARGMAAARGARRVFTDADLAYPVDEIDAMVRELDDGADVVIACRVLPESRYLMSPSFFHYLYTRHLMSRLFNRVVRVALLPGILDTQAGLKAFTARAAELIFPRLTVAGFGFDVELLYIARKHGLRVRQTAVQYRYDDEPSTVRFAADAAAMLRDLARIRWNDWRGRYA